MSTAIPYPPKTSDWGKTLIDALNRIFLKLDKNNENITKNINAQFEKFRDDTYAKIKEINTTFSTALALAQQNEAKIERLCEINSKQSHQIDFLECQNESLISENKLLRVQSNNQENYSRRRNIVIKGVTEEQQETNETCEIAARVFLKKQLKLSDNSVDAMEFERCHRLGSRDNRRNRDYHKRPIIIRFSNYKDKSTVWNAKTNITDRRYFISENFSRATDYNRRKLYAVFNKAKHMDQFKRKISLMGDVIIIDSVKYTVDTLNKLPNELNPRQFSEKTVGGYMFFGGIHSSFHPFSNFYSSEVVYKGNKFGSVEQGYQWSKAIFAEDSVMAKKLLHTVNPRTAKDLGAAVNGLEKDTWDAAKKEIMRELLKIKFSNAKLRKELLDTGDIKLAEAGFDTEYSIGLPLSSTDLAERKKWKGKNVLGEILCDIREHLK